MKQKPLLLLILALMCFAFAGYRITRTFILKPVPEHTRMQSRLPERIAELSAELAGNEKGASLILVGDATPPISGKRNLTDHVTKELKKQKLQIIAERRLGSGEHMELGENPTLDEKTFREMLAEAPDAAVLLSIVGSPKLRRAISGERPRIIVLEWNRATAERMLQAGAIDIAIVAAPRAAAGSKLKPVKNADEWFDRYFEVLRAVESSP